MVGTGRFVVSGTGSFVPCARGSEWKVGKNEKSESCASFEYEMCDPTYQHESAPVGSDETENVEVRV